MTLTSVTVTGVNGGGYGIYLKGTNVAYGLNLTSVTVTDCYAGLYLNNWTSPNMQKITISTCTGRCAVELVTTEGTIDFSSVTFKYNSTEALHFEGGCSDTLIKNVTMPIVLPEF